MPHIFDTRTRAFSDPTTDIVPVTPDDQAMLPDGTIALYVEAAGRLVIETITGAQRSLEVADYMILPVGVIRVWATGTTATGIHAFVH